VTSHVGGVMGMPRYPCWICGELIVAADPYIVCRPCLARVELATEQEDSPLPQVEIDAQVRRLLDNW
jgi:hypothetical protein